MIRLDHIPGEDPRACYFLSAVTGFLGLGGGSSSSASVSNSSSTTVDVQVNPQIDVAVDLAPVAELGADIASAGAAQADALQGALAGQGTAIRDGFVTLTEGLGGVGRALVVVLAIGLAFVVLKGARA